MATRSALLGLLFLGAVAVGAGTVGLVGNGGFEEVDSKGWAKGWTQWPVTLSAGAAVVIDGNISRSGTRSLRITQTHQDSYSRADQIVAVTPQKTYMVSCWIRGQDLRPAANAGGVRLFVGRNGTGHSFRTLGPGSEAKGTFPWTRYEIGPVPVGNQSKLAFLPYLHKTTGTAWFDDIEIVELTPDLAQRIEQLRVRNILLKDLELVEKACREAGDDEAGRQAAAMRERVSKETALPTGLDRLPIAAADLAAHHINAMMPHSWVERMPAAVFAEDGTLLPAKMDWSAFDAMLAYSGHVDTFVFLIPPARMKLMCVPEGEEAPFGGPAWERRACEWLRAVIAGLRERGVGHDRMLWSAGDEPSGSTVDLVVTMRRVFHRADPNIRVYSNFYSSATPDDVRKMDSVVDVWAPHLDCLNDNYLPICTQRKRELWAYRVQSKGTTPTSVRGAFWHLFAVGATGYSFWTYTDASADPWTPYDIDRHDYHAVYNGDPDEMIPSKRWEAWREGVEDYTLLHMLSEQGRDVPPDPDAKPVSEDSDATRIRHARTRVLQILANPDR